MGNSKLRVNIAKFAIENAGLLGDEREVKEKGPAPEPRLTRQHAQVKSKVVANQKGGMSYRDAVGGKKFKDMADRPPVNVAGDVSTGTQDLVVEIPEDTKAFQEWHGKALVGRCVDVATLTKLNLLLGDAGFRFDSLTYLGGLAMLIKFEEEDQGMELINNTEAWSPWFSSLEVWKGQAFRILVDHGNKIFESIHLKWKDSMVKVWVEEETRDWVPDCLEDSDSSESGSDDTEEMEEDQAVEVEKTALVMGTHQTHNGGSLPQVDLNWQPRSVSESGSPKEDGRAATVGFCEHAFESSGKVKRPIRKPSILRPKKAKCSSFNVSPMEDNRPKKRVRAEKEEPFDLNKLLGRGLFGDISRVAELEEGEIRDAEQEMPGESPPSALDLNSFASPADSNIHSHLSSGEDEIVADSVNFQEINEVEATVKMGEIVGAFLGNHCELVKEIINGEGINGVNQ
ncbi:hypothetical protein L1987_05636 [Smallanthus sonchifolius]|uniref:Uncharacterized protein n=1 Tax=Smallanthus sonchifolius TaxID=185202 RepID=A0ACB9JW07_9ASTR|nr:hypothetical protein L1987_05636 [Smallanthus sonchifolius]